MYESMIKKILTIAGSDSGGGAGIQADLKTITMLGEYGASVITAITAQNTVGVQGVYEVPLEGIAAQLDAVCQDIAFDGVKTGMLSSKAVVELICGKIKEYRLPNVVVDPVMVATSGDLLLQMDAIDIVRQQLLPCATLVTPNLKEAEVLTEMKIQSVAQMKQAGQMICKEMGCINVLVKGGHLEGEAVDVLCTMDGQCLTYTEDRILTKNSHGTGCTLSAALATCLGQGMGVQQAVQAAKAYLTRALYYGRLDQIGHGSGPVRHNYSLLVSQKS